MKTQFLWSVLTTAHLIISCSHAAPERFKRADVRGGGPSSRVVVPSSGEFRSRIQTPVNASPRHPGWRRVRASDATITTTTTSSRSTSDSDSLDFDKEKVKEEAFLDAVDEISRGTRCLPQYSNQKDVLVGDSRHVFLPKELQSIEEIPASQWKLQHFATANRVALLASILSQYKPETDSFKLLRSAMDQLVRLDHNFFRVRMAWTRAPGHESKKVRLLADYFVYLERKRRLSTESYNRSFSLQESWLQLPKEGKKNQYLHRLLREGSVHISLNTYSRDELNFAEWTPVYYSCELRKWLISYTALVVSDSEQIPGSNLYSLRGVVSIDMDISQNDFDQCDDTLEDLTEAVPMTGTHKCDRESSRCIFRPGHGWRRGGYICECRDGFFSTSSVNQHSPAHFFNGSLVESAWRLKNQRSGLAYDMIYTCKKCPEGCETCTAGTPCASTSGWFTKSSLLVISLICAAVTLLLVYYAYRY